MHLYRTRPVWRYCNFYEMLQESYLRHPHKIQRHKVLKADITHPYALPPRSFDFILSDGLAHFWVPSFCFLSGWEEDFGFPECLTTQLIVLFYSLPELLPD